jgi:nitrite transporter NirC
MFTFITSGYEHSIANMCGLALALFQPGAPPSGVEVSWALYGYNLTWTTLGNIVGGAVFVGGAYWLGSPQARVRPAADAPASDVNGTAPEPEVVGAQAQR